MDQTLHQSETLIVGSSGYVGQNLQMLLHKLGMSFAKGSHVPANKSFDFEIPRANESFMKFPKIQRIIHVGIPKIHSDSDDQSIMTCHIQEVLNFAEIAKKQNKVKYFYWTGSYWQDQKRNDHYTNAKRKIEEGLRSLSSEDFKIIALHLGDTYGGDDSRAKFFPAIINSLKKGHVLEVRNNKSFLAPIHINDVKNAFETLFSLESSRSLSGFQVFDLMGSEVVSVQDVLELVVTLKKGFRYQCFEENSDVFSIKSRHANIPGWCPRINLRSGFEMMLSGDEESKF